MRLSCPDQHSGPASPARAQGFSPQVGFTRLAAGYNAEVGLARLPTPSTSCFTHLCIDVDARDKRGHDAGQFGSFLPNQNNNRPGRSHMRIKPILYALVAALALHSLPASATEIRLARQFSMGYLQLNVMEHQQLIEKHAKALGLNDVKVSWFTFNGPTAVNEALISGNIDVGSGGVPGLLVLWARSKGTPQEVRGISALSSQPFLLNSRDPAIRTIKDFKDSDRIAVPAVRSS